jgi:hypothetical protein
MLPLSSGETPRRAHRTLVFALAAAIGLVGSACTANRVRITHLKQGLMRPVENGRWEVYREGSRFDVVENGQCVVDSRRTSCMWFGIVFDFTAPSSSTTLKCVWKSNAPIISATPDKILGRVTEENVDLLLRGRTGHEVRPGYVEVPWPGGESHLKYECNHQGAVVLSVEFDLGGSA